ncbi:hypothetical protein [Roseobacter weihaiensis]|uniref:hypothetical protein n=1 Tax=Roseobacter weihaiensis TaxID=2763262 RepID=UPI001D0B6157|nr:hypothetical protein [Roseobacter sp. H9]
MILSDIPDEELSPQVLSSKRRYLFWAAAYSIMHLSLCYYLYVIEPPVFSVGYNRAVAALIIGPFFCPLDLYLRQIFWPYWKEMRRRGGLPPKEKRKHPYDFELKVACWPVFSAALGVLAAVVFLWFEHYSHLRAWPAAAVGTVVFSPIISIGFYHSYFVWKGPDHE